MLTIGVEEEEHLPNPVEERRDLNAQTILDKAERTN